MEKPGPALRNRFKTLIIIFSALAEVIEVSCNTVGPGSSNSFDQVWQFRKDIVPTMLAKSTVPGCKTREALIIHLVQQTLVCFFLILNVICKVLVCK